MGQGRMSCAQCGKEMPVEWDGWILVDEIDKPCLEFCCDNCVVMYFLSRPKTVLCDSVTTSCDSGTFNSENPWVLD